MPRLCPADIKEHVKQLEKAVSGKEPRYVLRALRALPSTSRRLNANVLHKAVNGFFTSNGAVRDFLLGFLEEVRRWGPRCAPAEPRRLREGDEGPRGMGCGSGGAGLTSGTSLPPAAHGHRS